MSDEFWKCLSSKVIMRVSHFQCKMTDENQNCLTKDPSFIRQNDQWGSKSFREPCDSHVRNVSSTHGLLNGYSTLRGFVLVWSRIQVELYDMSSIIWGWYQINVLISSRFFRVQNLLKNKRLWSQPEEVGFCVSVLSGMAQNTPFKGYISKIFWGRTPRTPKMQCDHTKFLANSSLSCFMCKFLSGMAQNTPFRGYISKISWGRTPRPPPPKKYNVQGMSPLIPLDFSGFHTWP